MFLLDLGELPAQPLATYTDFLFGFGSICVCFLWIVMAVLGWQLDYILD